MLAQVITSWQVLAVTVVLVLYISLVNYVAKVRHRSGDSFSARRKRKKASKVQFPSAPAVVPGDDDLGLEEIPKG